MLIPYRGLTGGKPARAVASIAKDDADGLTFTELLLAEREHSPPLCWKPGDCDLSFEANDSWPKGTGNCLYARESKWPTAVRVTIV